ncbi:FUT4 (predicted) [Pycnogonum litorale]
MYLCVLQVIALSFLFFLNVFLISENFGLDECNRILVERVHQLRSRFRSWPIKRSMKVSPKIVYKPRQTYFFEYDTNQCLVNNCIFTEDQRKIFKADAILVNWFFLPRHRLNMMKLRRTAKQRWVFTTMESPIHESFMTANGQTEKHFKTLNGLFNWTMTYRQDSDIPRRYGYLTVANENPKRYKNFAKGKSKLVVWFVSNCKSSSKRISYVKELKKYISVDIMGKCSKAKSICNEDLSKISRSRCYERISRDYKFVIAFENSICKDYVTEKSFDVLRFDIVPIVMGGADYRMFLPPNSYINVADHESPESLALYLSMLDKNDSLYNMYFVWKQKFNFECAPGDNELCELCRKLNDPKEPPNTYNNFVHWWVHDAKCTDWKNSTRY